ncbi:hypothetical protein [Phaeobacter gallaeciensis]|uniref:hypothetical protein n=1 Tax=Phaeobacter gallaeciensis TaxID=60890 RepID=UPI00237EEB32|nr:hypothetical protein [Phaeobacter gallaeciensis]MDE4140962.1 hypothetical protein [Phaeobacter gallaeciensis]MDE4149407.1 hypothetical protein [Phaeobacter gallaeciensis]MDE4153400.1 hypothetical protein [Phaeobacter gallaeciensis]MDE4228789.1 hypothetical protein [Phaeobacter gallaeciensis]MDE4257864.1 hypothetical protein [Phaeobacter gallaeciensis]
MSDIRFTGEGPPDEDGTPGKDVFFESWRALAEAQPWVLIDTATLSDAQRDTLIAEMQPYAVIVQQRHGLDEVHAAPHPFRISDKLQRFTAANLPRLQGEFDLLDAAEQEANATLAQELPGFIGVTETFVAYSKARWEVRSIEGTAKDEPERVMRLDEAYTIGAIQLFSPIWHGVQVVLHVAKAKNAVETGDAEEAVRCGVIVGNSQRSLARIRVQVSDAVRANGGATEAATARDRWLRQRGAELRAEMGLADKGRWKLSVATQLLSELSHRIDSDPKTAGWRHIDLQSIRKKL